jgi:MFS family permease
VLWLEGLREIPGLALIFISALIMRLPLCWRAAGALVIMGTSYGLFATVHSYTALVAMAIAASLGMHMWMPLHSTLGMCLTTKEKSGRVMGVLSSVGSLAAIAGMGTVAVTSGIFETLSLRLPYIVGGVFIVIAGLFILRLPTTLGTTKIEPPRLLVKRKYWLYYVLNFFDGSRKQILGSFCTLILVDNFNFKVWQISTLLLVSSIINLIAAPYLGYLLDRFGERFTLSSSYALMALCCVGLATLTNIGLLVALVLAIKLLIVLGMGLSTYVNRIAPEEELTPTLSAGISINHITSVAVPIAAGMLLPIIGYEGIFLGAGAILALSLPFTLSLKVDESTIAQAELSPAD